MKMKNGEVGMALARMASLVKNNGSGGSPARASSKRMSNHV